jgi:DNA-binding Xre family transcriptional regulator
MRVHLNELRGRLADQRGQHIGWEEVAQAVGIRRITLIAMAKGKHTVWRPEYVDALCTYFGATVAELITSEPIELPIQSIRPDRKGARVGEKTKEE